MGGLHRAKSIQSKCLKRSFFQTSTGGAGSPSDIPMNKEYAYRATFYGYMGVLAILLYLALHG